MIEQGCQAARDRKSTLRMLLNAEELQSYLQCAFDHFAQTLDVPFDFIQAAFLNNPISPTFGGSVLKLAIAMMKSERKPDARGIFNKLSQLIASCIMLDSVRHNILGMLILPFPIPQICMLTPNRYCGPYLSSVYRISRQSAQGLQR